MIPVANLVSPSFPCDGGAPLHYTYPALQAIVRRSNRLTPDSQCVFRARHVSPILPGNTCRCAASSTRRIASRAVCRIPTQRQGRQAGGQAGRGWASCRGLINKWGFDLPGIIQELTSRHDRPITIQFDCNARRLASKAMYARQSARTCQYWLRAANVNN